MDFIEQLDQFVGRIPKLRDKLLTEEATKTSLVLPFFQILGYDVFNPFEFIPEYTADTGTKRGEKVDYAILKNREPIILIEVKSANVELNSKHMSQLFRYFTVTKAKFGILTNGIIYRFYSDLEETNKMDSTPFMEVDLLNLQQENVNELKRFRKDAFDMRGILDSATELKYTAMVKKALAEQFRTPTDQLVKALIGKDIYSGVKTQSVLDRFRDIIKSSFEEYVTDLINEKIKNAINSDSCKNQDTNTEKVEPVLTDEEFKILAHVKEMLITEEPIIFRKTSTYAYMQVGDSARKWICRVYIRQTNHLFVLHKFDNTDYETEYYFDDPYQLNQIQYVIQQVFDICLTI